MHSSLPFQSFAATAIACAIGLSCALLAPIDALSATRAAATSPRGAAGSGTPEVTTIPGGLVRWSEPGTRGCRMGGRAWRPLEDTCYFPIDLLQKPGVLTVTRVGERGTRSARVRVEPHDYGTQEVELPDIPQRNPSGADQRRMARESRLIARAFQRREGPAQFTLPLSPPAKPMPAGKSFGVNRVFNGKPAEQPHMGIDYAAGPGVPVLAVADGTVVLAQDLFHPGNAVFVDHGDGLVSMSFHLADIAVKAGDVVKKGSVLGKVGTTGRSTGPHLFFGVRWHNARIDPAPLFGDPKRIVAIR